MSLKEMIFGKSSSVCHCYNGGKQHNFQSRHNITESMNTLSDEQIRRIIDNTCYEDTPSVVNNLKTENSTYIMDICVWCGETRKP